MFLKLKKKHFILIALLILNVVILLGYNAKKWFSPVADLPESHLLVNSACLDEESTITLVVEGEMPSNYSIDWDLGDGPSGIIHNSQLLQVKHTFLSAGPHTITARVYFNFDATYTFASATVISEYCNADVSENCCDGSFAPIIGKKYVISAWVKEDESPAKTFENAYLTLVFGFVNDWQHEGEQRIVLGPFYAKGNIIDGWQRVEETFIVPKDVETISVRLNNQGDNDNVFFDDIRIYPFDGNMKSYVYDPQTKRLVAEMDQNNYATLYEYNDEGDMIRIKKETEKGIMTISESRSGSVKK